MSDHIAATPGRDRGGRSAEWRRAHPLAFSPMEFRAFRLAATGLRYKEIAHLLLVSEQTIKNQMSSARGKLECDTTIEAFVILGWLVAPDEQGVLVRMGIDGQRKALLDLAARATAAAAELAVHVPVGPEQPVEVIPAAAMTARPGRPH